MSSSRPADTRRAWSLRLRLLVGQIVVLAIVCLGITGATELALLHHLVAQLDGQLAGTSYRSALMYPEPPHSGWRHQHVYPRPGPGPRFLDAPGQPAGMVAAVVSHGNTVDAGYTTSSGDRAELSPAAQLQLSGIAGSRKPVTLNLDGLGRYRVVAAPSRSGGDVIVTGLSMANIDATLMRMLVIFGIVTVIALVAATTAGVIIIRRALAPLRRVAQTASKVAGLPLARGEVELPVRVLESDANPSTEVGQLGAALNQMLDHIAAALSARQASETRVRQFVADASHELRTPLAAIRGYTELTQRMGDDREAVAQAMGRVASETERMTRLVEDLLLLARLDSGRPLEREPVDLSRLAVDAVNDAHVAGPDHQWELDLPEEPVVDHRRRGTATSGADESACQRPHPHRCGHRRDDAVECRAVAHRAAGHRQRTRHPSGAAVRSFRTVRPGRLLALSQGRQYRAGPGDRLRGCQGAQRNYRGGQHAGPYRVHGAVATQRMATARCRSLSQEQVASISKGLFTCCIGFAMSTPVAVPVILYVLPSLVAEALPWPPCAYCSVTPLTLPSWTAFTASGSASASTTLIPVVFPPTAIEILPPALVQIVVPWTFWSLPSMMTFDELLPPADTEPPGTEVETPFDLLLLEQPVIPAARIAAPATATVS